MIPTDLLTIVALVLNFSALCLVAYQSFLNRKSLGLSRASIDDDRKVRQIEMLPRAHFIFEVQAYLNRYLNDMDAIVDKLSSASLSGDSNAIQEISAIALKTPRGLVNKSSYENSPAWLSQIWMAGAQYYYDFNEPLGALWNEKESRVSWSLVQELIERGRENNRQIRRLLNYIERSVPEAYASAPASIDDSSFFET